jgi:hypothetical protein
MSTKEDQPSLLARIRALSERIALAHRRFSLPKGHKERYETHGAALGLQRIKRERSILQGQLDPIRLIATGVSCRDCLHFADVDEPTCWYFRDQPKPTRVSRSNVGECGPEARSFDPHRLAQLAHA